MDRLKIHWPQNWKCIRINPVRMNKRLLFYAALALTVFSFIYGPGDTAAPKAEKKVVPKEERSVARSLPGNKSL
jgi:hypothetical protein